MTALAAPALSVPKDSFALDDTPSHTARATVSSMEEILFRPFPVLDHGFIRVIDYMGDDAAIVQAARVSYGKGTKQKSQDQGLINYLMRNRHTSPFEMNEIKLHVKMPIFVARQWVRHRTANINEYSARYSILSKEYYIPTVENLAVQSSLNKQGRERSLTLEEATTVQDLLRRDAEQAYKGYAHLLNETEEGNIIDLDRPQLARELARMNLSLNYYTEWYWKIDLHNLLHFIALRADSHAQYEIRVYAETLLEIVKQWVPMVHAAFTEYRLGSVSLSKTALSVVQRMLKGETITQETSGLSSGEWHDLTTKLGNSPAFG